MRRLFTIRYARSDAAPTAVCAEGAAEEAAGRTAVDGDLVRRVPDARAGLRRAADEHAVVDEPRDDGEVDARAGERARADEGRQRASRIRDDAGIDGARVGRACVGHALELAKPGQSVRWLNDATGVSYVVTPLTVADKNNACRDFTFIAAAGSKKETSKQRACRGADGEWSIASR